MSGSTTQDVGTTDANRLRVLRVRIGDEQYAVEVGRVAAVTAAAPVTRVPNTPPGVAGVARLRGETAVVVDTEHVLGAATASSSPGERRAVVFEHGADETPVAILVDEIVRNESHDVEDVEPVRVGDDPETAGLAAVIETDDLDLRVIGPDRLLATALGDEP